jgi:hypothetical protein
VLALCRGLPESDSFANYRTLDLFQATGIVFDQSRARQELAGSGIVCPAPDERLLRLYLSHALERATP